MNEDKNEQNEERGEWSFTECRGFSMNHHLVRKVTNNDLLDFEEKMFSITLNEEGFIPWNSHTSDFCAPIGRP